VTDLAPQPQAETPAIELAQGFDLSKTADKPVGVVKAVEGRVEVIRADGEKATLKAGDPVYEGDQVATSDGGRAGLEFADGTRFSLAGDGRMSIDEMFYHADKQDGSAVMSVFKGAFAFVSGQISKVGPEAVTLNTPMGSIGIRGTAGTGDVADDGTARATLLEERGQEVGELVFSNGGGSQTVNTLGTQGTMSSPDSAPTFAPITLQAIAQQFGAVIQGIPGARQLLSPTLYDAVQRIQGIRDESERDDEAGQQQGEGEGGESDTVEVSDADAAAEALDRLLADKPLVASLIATFGPRVKRSMGLATVRPA